MLLVGVNPEEIIELLVLDMQALNAFLAARGDVEQHLFEVTNGNAELSLHAPRLSELLDFQVLHVGDSLADDVLGAKRAVHLRRGTAKDAAQAASAAPDATIASLSELPALLTSWNEVAEGDESALSSHGVRKKRLEAGILFRISGFFGSRASCRTTAAS
ncbi:hypothetical protein AK812_SmicGene2985 [Symbiodinium microadriaticum]|uniref:Uncharacterized protein n=1 Tax=Symbiodinium microadriaticum TaxID=2951 RepID=A0A1Q9F081_SYMMI|nr:hypothetical protein AK812_SmicGene2985 [Symbiodinium microadriaticum]